MIIEFIPELETLLKQQLATGESVELIISHGLQNLPQPPPPRTNASPNSFAIHLFGIRPQY